MNVFLAQTNFFMGNFQLSVINQFSKQRNDNPTNIVVYIYMEVCRPFSLKRYIGPALEILVLHALCRKTELVTTINSYAAVFKRNL